MSVCGPRLLYRFHRLRTSSRRVTITTDTTFTSKRAAPLDRLPAPASTSSRRPFCRNASIIMADDDNRSAEGAQSAAAAAAATSSAQDASSVTAAATTSSEPDKGSQDGGQQGKHNQKGGKGNRNQKRNAKWKQGWKDKRKNKRQQREGQSAGEGEEDKNKRPKMLHWKKEYDAGKVSPHEGSFAHPNMQKLFDVKVDVPSDGKKSEDEQQETTAADAKVDSQDEAAEEKKVPKRKLAMLVSFLGSNHSGFQINTAKRTLHAELELGLFRAGIISPRNFGHPSKYSWSNSARTDKGVHAAAQVCSFKGEMIYHHEMGEEDVRGQLDKMRERVNECLPEDVRVADFERVTRAFCARTNRDKVRYQYMVPSYLLCPREEVIKAFPELNATKTSGDDVMTPMEAARLTEDALDENVLARARNALIDYRVTPEQMERLKAGLKLFEGTHSFHNYTRRIGANDANAARYILSFAPLPPILVAGDANEDGCKQPETQWIPLQIVGQSFLLNQIRKMVSAAVDLARGAVSEEQIEHSFSRQCRMKVNVAPAQGLFLDRSYFELYNKHKVEKAPKHGDSRDRDTLDWVESEGKELPPAVRRIEEFKNEKIIPHIVQEEAKESNFVKYVYSQDALHANKVYGLIDDSDKATGRENDDSAGVEAEE